ncbi:MAG: hypothetical protein COS99_07910 [Candidatus Omnitrophica bacterium CG07_land_8_20_14_0_80_42_15]|uniref:DUF3108 domain-containing protein n=1 Tax=Candidatus Aquitaenariimonas noxiae TaxID=1974741 RepID=A0A2J0KQU0_9BACT|nr:MAG: hypothetical protein COS99_07910 [Candidatus Omnitrophica bacterium CG07_land_8_20_14_0_80_42_15]
MMKNKIVLLVIFLTIILVCLTLRNTKTGKLINIVEPVCPVSPAVFSAPEGERLNYEVRLGGLSLGSAMLSNFGSINVDGRLLNRLTFETNAVRFKDVETIYSDPQTFMPVKIEREICKWLSSENITEVYDQDNFTVTITKHKYSKQEKTTIKKESPIHNPILLSYYARGVFNFMPGGILNVNLPGNKFEIKMVSIEDVEVPAGKFKAYRFESSPKEIEIWVSADERRIPLKMQGIGTFGYSLELKNIEQQLVN